MNKVFNRQCPEHGGAGIKLLVALSVLILLANAAFNYIPVAYQGENFKQDIKSAVVKATYVPKNVDPVESVRAKLNSAVRTNQIPPDSYIEVKEINKVLQARVYYTKEVPLLPFGFYNHVYTFDHTETPEGFIED